MATNFDNLRSERPPRRDDIAVDFAEIKRLLREIDDFVSNLKILEETLAQHADDDADIGVASHCGDDAGSKNSATVLDAPERKKPPLI